MLKSSEAMPSGPGVAAVMLHYLQMLTPPHGSATGLFQLANLLRENTLGSIAISVLFAAAALTHWQAGGRWLSAAIGEQISQAATTLIYIIAGVPAFVDLTFDLASLHIDTHVLMTLAVLGTLAIGGALEVRLLACQPIAGHMANRGAMVRQACAGDAGGGRLAIGGGTLAIGGAPELSFILLFCNPVMIKDAESVLLSFGTKLR